MFVVDTNVFIYAADEYVPEHAACLRLVSKWRAQKPPWYTTWGVLYEFLRVVTHARALRRPLSMENGVALVRSLLISSGLTVLTHTERHEELLAQTVREVAGLRGNIAHDLNTAVLMREHGIRQIVTRDADFKRFPFLEVIDPFRSDGHQEVRERSAARYGTRKRRPVRKIAR